MFSIYSSAFNLVKNGFNYLDSLDNFTAFADEVVISTISNNEDNTLEILKDYQKSNPKLKIKVCDLDRKDPIFWGKLRDAGLQECTQEFCISLDLDELIPIWKKYDWMSYARSLGFSEFDAYLVPLINLWGDVEHIRWDSETNYLFKWVLHKNPKSTKPNLKRGPVNFALLPDGTVDIDKSDTNELIYTDGNLVKFSPIISNKNGNAIDYISECQEKIFVYHTGYLSFENRVLRNKNFWNEQFKIQAGNRQDASANRFAPTEQQALWEKSLVKHGLKLWYE